MRIYVHTFSTICLNLVFSYMKHENNFFEMPTRSETCNGYKTWVIFCEITWVLYSPPNHCIWFLVPMLYEQLETNPRNWGWGHSRSPTGDGNRFIILSHLKIHLSKRFFLKRFKLSNLSREEGSPGKQQAPAPTFVGIAQRSCPFIYRQLITRTLLPGLKVSLWGALRHPELPLAPVKT